jgi:hypothetical protein
MLEKLPRHERKLKSIDESIVNISDISSSSHDIPKTNNFYKNPKIKLKFQLEDLSDTVKSMEYKYGKNDLLEINDIKGEVNDWGSQILEINQNLKTLIEKVSDVEANNNKIKQKNIISDFKKEILEEIKKKQQIHKKKLSYNETNTQKDSLVSLIRTKTEERLQKMNDLEKTRSYKK